ncbi:MAG: O-antigen ligase family protein [Caldisericia bacterium]|nr:O-antigen ligase family protein [Caldisericia bacterium]
MKKNIKNVLNAFLNFGIEFGFYVSIISLLFITRIPLYYQGFGAGITILFWLVKSLLNKRFIYKHYPWHWTELFICIWIWTGFFWSIEPQQTVLYGIVFTSGCILEVLISSNIVKKGHVIRILTLLFILLFGYAVYYIKNNVAEIIPLLKLSTVWRSQFDVKGVEISFNTAIGGRNSLGGVYSLILPLSVAISFFGIKFKELKKYLPKLSWLYFIIKPLAISFSITFFAMVMFSGSRGSYLGMVAGLIFLVLAYLKWEWTIIAGLTATLFSFIPITQIWLKNVYFETISADIGRNVIWQNTTELLKLYWVTGIGVGSFQTVYNLYFPSTTGSGFIHAHNFFLNVGVEMGVIGLFLFCILWFQYIYFGTLFGRRKLKLYPFLASINIGLASMVFGYLIRCLVDYTI